MLRFLVLSIGLLAVVNCDTNYRLNSPIRPSSYSILVTPFFDTNDSKAFTFDGAVNIIFSTENNINVIKLHSEGLEYNAANITVSDEEGKTDIPLVKSDPVVFDVNYTFAYINLASELLVGVNYILKIEYTGKIRTKLNGFYRNYYYENGTKKWLGATQMEPTHARKVFPCFDEPELKAKFTISIIRPGHFEPSLANTEMMSSVQLPDGNVLEIFHPTPKMSTYLVAFLVSEFKVGGNTTIDSRGFGIYTRPEARNQSQYAFEIGTKVVKALGEYFGIDYYSTDSKLKLDHIALPDFEAGAMENWGLIKYREALLLYVPEVSTPYYKYRVAQIVAHETTHMWFGNLVTCHWWGDAWLNEGFANYFQDYITAMIEPDVESNDVLITGSVYSAYGADESPKSAPISNPSVNSPADISEHFGTITYQKAGSVIRMMHHLLGDDAFKLGLNEYLTTNQFSSGYPDLLYAALEAGVNSSNAFASYPGFDVTGVMSSWISQAGYPVVKVNIDYEIGTIELTQKRFYTDSTITTNELYKIPITYTSELSPNFDDTKPAFIMDKATYKFEFANISDTHSWILFNVQETGLYRVDYDQHSWSIISNALKGEKRAQIHHINRAKIVNDLFSFFFAGEQKFELLVEVIEFLKQETDYSVWIAAVRNLEQLRRIFLGNDALQDVENFTLKLMEPIINKLGYSVQEGDSFGTLRNRMQILEFACKIGHQGCIENTALLFQNLKQNGIEISPSLRPVAYCSGLRLGSEEDFDFLWERMKTTNIANEARIIGDALACSSSKDRLKGYLVSMLEEDSPIRVQDLTVPLTGVLSNYSNIRLVLDGLKDNLTLWTEIYTNLDAVFVSVASSLHSEEEFLEFEYIISTCVECSNETLTAARSALATASKSVHWAESHKMDILKTLKSAGVENVPKMLTILIAVLFLFVS